MGCVGYRNIASEYEQKNEKRLAFASHKNLSKLTYFLRYFYDDSELSLSYIEMCQFNIFSMTVTNESVNLGEFFVLDTLTNISLKILHTEKK